MKKNPAVEGEKALEIVSKFGDVIPNHTNLANPVSKLPYSIEEIKEAIRIIFMITEVNYQQGKDSRDYYEDMKDTLEELYIHLATFISDNDAGILNDARKTMEINKENEKSISEAASLYKIKEMKYKFSISLLNKIEQDILLLKNEVKDMFEKVKTEVKTELIKRSH
jgi:NCAIR mutase (PurE)-related protein